MRAVSQKLLSIASEADMLRFGQALAKACAQKGAWIYLIGDLGAGKTTLVRGFLQGLGYTERVKSPTYTLVEPYTIDNKPIYHFDLYRIHTPLELQHLGLEEYFTQSAICLVEWADRFLPYLPPPDICIFFTAQLFSTPASKNMDMRQLHVESNTLRASLIMKKLQKEHMF
jgi:tRNA threonylcarbamoyladenosine biosynthesis protein TsaE